MIAGNNAWIINVKVAKTWGDGCLILPSEPEARCTRITYGEACAGLGMNCAFTCPCFSKEYAFPRLLAVFVVDTDEKNLVTNDK
jgi:hypothetical protein